MLAFAGLFLLEVVWSLRFLKRAHNARRKSQAAIRNRGSYSGPGASSDGLRVRVNAVNAVNAGNAPSPAQPDSEAQQPVVLAGPQAVPVPALDLVPWVSNPLRPMVPGRRVTVGPVGGIARTGRDSRYEARAQTVSSGPGRESRVDSDDGGVSWG